MKYYLAEYQNKDNNYTFNKVNWEKLLPLKDHTNLKDIIEFINIFDDFNSMCLYLCTNNILKNEPHEENNLKIVYNYHGQIKWINGPFIYRQDKSFLEPYNLLNYLLTNYKNPQFLAFFINQYEEKLKVFGFLQTFNNFLYQIRNSQYIKPEDTKNILENIKYLVSRECYKYDRKNHKYKKENDSFLKSYKGLYDLAICLNNYSKFDKMFNQKFVPLEIEEKEEFIDEEEFHKTNKSSSDIKWLRK